MASQAYPSPLTWSPYSAGMPGHFKKLRALQKKSNQIQQQQRSGSGRSSRGDPSPYSNASSRPTSASSASSARSHSPLSSRLGSASPKPPRRQLLLPRSTSAYSPTPLPDLLYESSESRLHHLHFQSLHAAYVRDFDSLISLRLEMIAFHRFLGGRKSPQLTLETMALADSYLKANYYLQAIEHATPLIPKLEEMQYAQGVWDVHMLLGRAHFGLGKQSLTEPNALAPPPLPGLPPSDSAKSFESARKHFQSALEVTRRGHETFFMHTTIRLDKDMDRITVKKSQEAALALSYVYEAQGISNKQMETLTALWEALDAHLTSEVSREEKERIEEAKSRGEKPQKLTREQEKQMREFDINHSLQSFDLYVALGQCFHAAGDDANAIDNLKRAVQVANSHKKLTFAGALRDLKQAQQKKKAASSGLSDDEDENAGSDASPFPHPSTLHFPLMRSLGDALLLLSRSYARSEQHQAAILMFENTKLWFTQLRAYNKELNAYYNRPARLQVHDFNTPKGAPLPPVPAHVPTSSTEVSHAAIDLAFQSLSSREFGYHHNMPLHYDFKEVFQFVSSSLLFVEKELALLHLALCSYEEAAVHQEEVCSLLEKDAMDEEEYEEYEDSNDAPMSNPSVSGLYQLDVAKAQKRLGDIYVAAGQPRTACAAYKLALQILHTLFGVKKIHDVAVRYSTHSGYDRAALVARPKSPTRARISQVFGSTISLFTEIAPKVEKEKIEERGIPPAVIKLMASLRKSIHLLTEEIRKEDQANQPESSEATEQPVEDSSASSDPNTQPTEYDSTQYTAASDEYDYYGASEQQDTTQDEEAAEAQQSTEEEPADTDEYGNAVDASAPSDDLPYAPAEGQTMDSLSLHSPAKMASPSKSKKRHDQSSSKPTNPYLGGGHPPAPYTFDHLVGSSSVFAETMYLRASSGDEQQVRKSMYDSFAIEKVAPIGDQPEPEETKAARRTRPQSAAYRQAHPTTNTAVTIEHDNGSVTVAGQPQPTQADANYYQQYDHSQYAQDQTVNSDQHQQPYYDQYSYAEQTYSQPADVIQQGYYQQPVEQQTASVPEEVNEYEDDFQEAD